MCNRPSWREFIIYQQHGKMSAGELAEGAMSHLSVVNEHPSNQLNEICNKHSNQLNEICNKHIGYKRLNETTALSSC